MCQLALAINSQLQRVHLLLRNEKWNQKHATVIKFQLRAEIPSADTGFMSWDFKTATEFGVLISLLDKVDKK